MNESTSSQRTASVRPVRHLAPPKTLGEWLKRHRYAFWRHSVQLLILLLFAGFARWGWTVGGVPILDGDLSGSTVLSTIPLTDPFAMLERWVAGHAPTLTALTGALIVTGVYVLLGSRVFCGWVCPMNLVTDLAAMLRRKMSLKADWIRFDERLRYLFAGATLVVSALTGTAAFEVVSPQALLWRDVIFGTGLWAAAIALTIFSLDLAIAKHAWCGHLCPLGAFWGALTRLNRKPCIKITFESKTCTHCGDCLRVCPEPQIIKFNQLSKTGTIPVGDCIQCGRCISVCPEESLKFNIADYVRNSSDIKK